MSIDYIVAALPALAFGSPVAMTWERFLEIVGADRLDRILEKSNWADLEAQLRNATAIARNGENCQRATIGLSLYWKQRILAAFQQHDVLKRDELLDRVWWDAAGELTQVASPLGPGALATYAVRLRIALKRSRVSADRGQAAFDRLTAATRTEFNS